MLTDHQLLALNCQGLIPGPHESEDAFAARAAYCTQLKENISRELQLNLGEDMSASPGLLQPGAATAKAFYDIDPQWIPLFFSNYQLPFWHGGCAWIFQEAEDRPLGALLQLRQTFRHADRYLGLYHRDELTAHELAHVGRMAFEEPHFEEVFAYRTSPAAFRRWLGPIVQSSVESMFVLIVLGLIFFVDISLIALGQPDAYRIAMWLKLIPVGILAAGLWRLWRRQRCLSLCLKSLRQCLQNKDHALAVAYRLTDHEIRLFARLSPPDIRAYVQQHKGQTVRWRMIAAAYF